MDQILEYILYAFATLFSMVNPLGVMPVYTTMTAKLPSKEARNTALKATIVAGFTLLLFSLSGKFIFDFFHISINGLRIVGGVIFFMAGYDMLQARLIRTKTDTETTHEYIDDISITPLGIPMIAGPGAMTVSIVLMNDAETLTLKFVLVGVIAVILLLTFLILISSRKIIRKLGDSGNKVLTRIMGLIVMVIAVEFIFSGLKPILRDILMIGN
ncbi:MAG: NAAT family transporter [Melioribacteraceae bacterium]|nr:NAAT family transporter [Melioribacteraceae bacterium]